MHSSVMEQYLQFILQKGWSWIASGYAGRENMYITRSIPFCSRYNKPQCCSEDICIINCGVSVYDIYIITQSFLVGLWNQYRVVTLIYKITPTTEDVLVDFVVYRGWSISFRKGPAKGRLNLRLFSLFVNDKLYNPRLYNSRYLPATWKSIPRIAGRLYMTVELHVG